MTSVKVAISFPADLFAALDLQARAEGLSRSSLVQRAVDAYLARVAASEITRRLNEVEAALTPEEREEEAIAAAAWRRLAARSLKDEGW